LRFRIFRGGDRRRDFAPGNHGRNLIRPQRSHEKIGSQDPKEEILFDQFRQAGPREERHVVFGQEKEEACSRHGCAG
jgi:hypothetical protein